MSDKLSKRRYKTPVVMVNGVDIREYDLTEFEAAKIIKMSFHWLRRSRMNPPQWAGPPFIKIDGYHIRYRRRDLEHFLATRNGGPVVVDPAKRMATAR